MNQRDQKPPKSVGEVKFGYLNQPCHRGDEQKNPTIIVSL